MDKSKNYITLCSQAKEIQQLKYDKGFQPGDFVFLEKKVEVIAADVLEIRQSFSKENPDKNWKFIFALLDSRSRTRTSSEPEKAVNLAQGMYSVRQYLNPVWLPRADQLESFYYKTVLMERKPQEWLAVLNNTFNLDESEQFNSIEKIALSCIMKIVFNKNWLGASGWI